MIAVITAGGRVGGELAAAIGGEVKALARVGGRTLLEASVAAASKAGATEILVVGGDAVRAQVDGRVDRVLDEAPEGRENIRRAMCAAAERPLLLMTSDTPFISATALGDFLSQVDGADVALPLASEADYLAAYPGAPPHVTAIGGERVANGNVVYFGPGTIERVLPASQRLFDARKSLWRMASLLGPLLLLRFASRTLRIAHVEQRAATLLGVRARAVRNASPALCFDIDTLDDYRYAVARAGR